MKLLKQLLFSFILVLSLVFVSPNIIQIPGQISHVEAAVKLNKKSITLLKGQSSTLKITGTKKKAKWSSNKKSVVSVSSKGKIVAKKIGKATVTAKIGKKSYKCTVTVINPSLSDTTLILRPNQRKSLKIKGYTGNIQWESSNDDIADVTCKGKIIANEVGTCIISANVNGIILSCKVTVKIPDPICFPNQIAKINGITINSFSASYIGYIPYNDYSQKLNSTTFYYPYKYRIKIKGNAQPNSSIKLSFLGEMPGYTPLVPANNIFVTVLTDNAGNFEVNEDVNFNCLSSKIYIFNASIQK